MTLSVSAPSFMHDINVSTKMPAHLYELIKHVALARVCGDAVCAQDGD